MAASSSSGPRYAPEDPTLPKPWRGLVDGSTGYLYFWNPETNVTQYERPIADPLPPPPPPPPLPLHAKPAPIASSVHHPRRDSKDDHDHAASRTNQSGRGSSSSHLLNGSSTAGGHSALQSTRAFARGHGSSEVGGGSSAEAYRRQHEITATGDNVPPPLTTFESTGFPAEILKEVQHAGFSAPTPIQAQSWPIALESRDIVAIAKTGSGKTLGYLIPGFIHLKRLRNNSQMGPTVLVLSPTRELATQIQDEAVKFGRSSRISCVCLYGGAPKGPQLRDLDRGADVVVATPGRLNDFLEMRRVSLRQVSYLVLDEADRMLDMGFEPQIRKIVKEIPARRQTLMFTATWPKEVRKIAADLLVNPAQVNIGSVDELVANKAITQYVEVIIPSEKQRRLEQILRSQEPGSKVIIFCSTKRMCDQLARNITRQFGAAAIHGDKSQTERDWVLSQFRTGRSPILVATDVAARGLDIKDIRVVINYDFPTGVEDYVHRIGRTGRAGATGVSYTFFSDQDSKYASDLVKVLEGADQRVPPELREMVSRGGYGGKSRRWGSGSGARDGGRSHGGGHSDLGYGGRGGRGEPPYSGRSNSGRGGRGRSPPRNRYDRSYRDEREIDAYGRRDTKSSGTASDYRAGGKRRSRSRSFSRSPNRRHGSGWANSRSRSRSRSGNHGGHSRSRSRSRSGSRGFNRYGGGAGSAREQSLPLKREPSPGNYGTTSNAHSSPKPTFQEHKLQQLSPDNGGAMREVHPDHSPSPRKERSRSPPYKHNDNERGPGRGSASPVQNGPVQSSPGPCNNGDEEEEGMIPADEEGMIRPEVGMRSSEMASEEPNSFN